MEAAEKIRIIKQQFSQRSINSPNSLVKTLASKAAAMCVM